MVDLGEGCVLPSAVRVVTHPSREAWLAARLQGLGGSDVPRILGLSPHGGPWSVAAPRLGIPLTDRDTAVARRGRREEKRIIEDYRDLTGHRVVGPLGTVHIQGPWLLLVTPDAFELDPGAGWGVQEDKTDTTRFRWGRSGQLIESWTPSAAREVREDYAAQCYTILEATGLGWCRLVVRRTLDDLRVYTLVRDERTQAAIRKLCVAWWSRHIEGGQLPLYDDSAACREAVRRLYPAGDGVRPATAREVELAQAVAVATETIGQLDTYRATCRAELAASIGQSGAASVTWRSGFARPHRATLGTDGSVRVTIQHREAA